jgi:CubicO group peptidase (beta-lactamase class C family)
MRADDKREARGTKAGFSTQRLALIDRLFTKDVERGLLPGAVLLIERGGETVMRQAWGYRERATNTPMTIDTIFRIYSMTKPMVSLVTMMLAAEGRLRLAQPISDIIPSFANLKVWTYGALIDLAQPPTVQDLLRHTAGLIYARSGGPVARLYEEADLLAADMTNEEFADRIATLPLAHQPGRVWDYSHATDVLGRVVEVVTGQSLGAALRQRLIEPLGMVDTGFVVPGDAYGRVAEALPGDTLADDGRPLFDPRRPRTFEPGGMGLVSTLDDYGSFARMLLNGGAADDRLYLSRTSLGFMTADHIGPATGVVRLPGSLLGPGFGFGLGFAVRTETGAAPYPGSVGEFNWSGIGGTYFWIDPAQDLFVVLLTQSPRHRMRYRELIKTMVYDALVEPSRKPGKHKRKRDK